MRVIVRVEAEPVVENEEIGGGNRKIEEDANGRGRGRDAGKGKEKKIRARRGEDG
jgi:hypothetical protein